MNASLPLTVLHARFLELLPRIETHARIVFRDIRCAQQRADRIAEVIALSWKWFLRLCERGKNVEAFPTTFATLVVRAVRSGRRLTGLNKSKDVMNVWTQRQRGFAVVSLPARSGLHGDAFEQALQDNTQTPPPDQAAFRVDFPAWMSSRTERDRRVIRDLMHGERTGDVSKKHGISPGRVSQLRIEFQDDWNRFCADPIETDAA